MPSAAGLDLNMSSMLTDAKRVQVSQSCPSLSFRTIANEVNVLIVCPPWFCIFKSSILTISSLDFEWMNTCVPHKEARYKEREKIFLLRRLPAP